MLARQSPGSGVPFRTLPDDHEESDKTFSAAACASWPGTRRSHRSAPAAGPALERMHAVAEYAQIAIICGHPSVIQRLSCDWALTELESNYGRGYSEARDCPIDFEIETTTTHQRLPILTEEVSSSSVDG